MAANNKDTDWRAKYRAMMTDPDYAKKASEAVENTRKVNTDLMNKSEEFSNSLSLDKPTSQPLDLSRVEQMQAEQAARATMPDDDSGVADLAVQAYADARKQIGDEVSKQMADDKSMAFVHPMAAGILRSAKSMEAGDVQKTFDRMLENNAVRQAIETKANKELTAALGKNPALTEEQQKDIYNKSVQRQIDVISNKVNQYLLDVNAPKSEGEYVLKSAVGNSLIGKSMLQAARNISGLESAEYDYGQQALADYDANKATWYGKGGAAIGGLLLDAPMMQGIGSVSSAVLGRGASMALGKAASNTLWGKMLIGQATAAGTLGGYNFTSTLASQMMGGHFDAGELFSSTMHGVGLGALTGGMTPLLRGATAGMGAVGKTATMGGGILGEAAAFSAPEWAETFSENPYDFKAYAEALGTNVMVIAGLKASNLPKTVQEYKEWWNEGKTSGFTDADYKALSDYALAKGYANDGAFTYQDGVYQRSMADRATGGRNILTLTKLEGGKEHNLAMEMYQDPNVPLSMKTKIAAKMGLPAPNPVLPNAVEARDNVVNTYYEYREQMSDGTYVTRRILVDSKEMPSKRKARAAASEFGRTKARQNSIIQSEAEANTDATNAIVMARLTEQAWRSGTNVSDEVARMYNIAQRAQRGEASAEDVAYYQSIMEGTTEVTDRIKAGIKDKTGVDIDEVLKQEGTFNTAQDKALTMYTEALASLKDSSKPTTERGTTASQASIADYIELKGMGIEQTRQLLNDPTAKVSAEKEIRNKYNLWLKYFDGQMSEEQLASRLGYNLDSTKGLMDFVNEEAFFRGKAANRIAYNAANAAKRLLEQGSGGVRFTEDGKVKLQGVPYSIAVDESIVDRYRAAQQGSGENYQRIANDALKDIIRQSEQPIEEMLKQMATDEQAIANEPQTEQEAVTQQMVDNRLAEIDTDLQGIEADGIQRVNINDKPAMIVKGKIATLGNGEIDRANSSTEVAYIPLDENGRPIKNEQGKPVVEVGVKPSNVRISEVEPWRTVDDYKRAEEQRIRDNNRLTDEAMAQVNAEGGEVKEELPTLDKVVAEPKDADELIAMCDGDKALALDVAVDELAKAQAAKGKGASTAETIDINRRIRTYQQIVDRLSASEMPDAAAVDVESEQPSEATKAEPQVTDDMEFVYQKDLGENHEGMESMQTSDGRYKWVGLQRGELTATMGERDVELLDGLAKKLGVAVIPINVADSAVNGYYRDGNVYVNTNRGADWTMRWVAGHELLHDVAKKSPEAYDAYKQAVLDMWGSDYINDQVKQIIDDYAASGKTIDREQALTELANDFGGELFNSRDGLNILDNILKGESRKGNTGFVNTIKQWWERLKEFFGVTPYASEVEKKLADAYKEAIANAEKFGKNYDFDYSIIGKRGAENLDKVEEATIRLDNLAIAREMESSGKDAKTIRMATGWERGADNKWRYEIPDELDLTDGEIILNIAIDKAKWKRAAEKLGTTAESLKSENDNLKAEVERRRMISTIEQMLADNESTNDLYVRELKKSTLLKQLNFYKTGLKYKDSDDVEKMWADLKDSIDKVDVLKLSEVMGADNAIFKAYPELADIDVRFDAKGNTSVLATVSNDGKEIWINPYNIESQSSVFLHEIQHLIQKIEGFARGGSSRMFDIPEEHKYANMPGSVIKSMREQAEFARKKLSEYSTIEEIREYYKANRSWLTSSEKDAVISVMDALMYGESVEDAVSSLEKDYQQAIDDLNWSLTSKDSPYSKYTRLGGEVESRNVQNRMNMTDEERRNTLLSETEDVAREDQILLFDNLGESQMGSRVDKRMAEIGSYFSERELNDNERAVVDVFGGKADNKSLTVMRDGKEHKVVMRQGTENKAGTKHSLFRHYGTNVGVITNDDLLLIPEVIERGERTDKGNNRVYQLEKNGARYTVLTEQQNRTERFCDFYSNKKGDNTRSSNTQLSAQAYSDITNYTAKVEQNSDNAKKSGENLDAENNIVRNLKERPAEVANDDLIANEGAEMSIVRDRNKIEELENEELVPMFRTFQILDGALYSPMATIQRGKKVHSVVEGDWWKADENPDLAKVKAKGKKDEFYDKDDDRISKKDGQWVITIDGEGKPLATNGNSLSYYFNLKKGEKGDVVTDDLDVAYNPYIHSSKSALNDQFKGAYLRPNLVLAEVLVPKSEIDGTNRYKADYAKDGIGEIDWNSGSVIKQAVAAGHPGRKVALSRYAKIGKVFTDAEWADKIDEELSAYKGQITLPFIAFPPDVLRELANRGYKVEPPTSKKAQPYYEAWLNGEKPTDSNGGGKPIIDGKRVDESVLDYAKRMSEESGKKNLLNGGSYFSGGGLLEEGLKGIVDPRIAVEYNQKVAGVYRNNFGEHIVTADVRDVDPAALVKDIDGPVAYFHASPVCKNFSNAKRNAEELPLDKETAQSTAKFISEIRPKIVTIENVKGYRGSDAMKIILDELEKQGYNYDVDVYNAADYGAYTSRERLIVRAVRDWPLPPKPIKMLADERPSGWFEAVADIIDELPQAKNGVADWMDTRLKAMGIDYRNIDKPLYIFGSGYAKDKIGHAFADELVPTLRTKGGDVIVMPDGRVLKATPRVLARISGMSDEYTMPKSDDLAHTIVGNGIPVQLTKAVMGSLIENVKSDLDAGNTEYSIIGKRGAANLDKRDETSIRVDNMVTAEEMEKAGKDAKTIRMATGWERGADGKWRYEVKDLVMLPAEQWIGKRGKKLSDIVENADELFAAYPELANVKIKEGNGKTYGGSYSSGVITLDTYLAKLWMKRLPDSLPRANKYMNEALIHEIQHYIQDEEGFAKGGNESMVLDKDAVSKISALIDDSNKLATQYNNMIERGVYEGREAVKDEIIALRAKANAIRNSNKLGSYGYKSLAGEVEARNTEKRSDMTEEERKNSLLADTEDVGRDEQIVYGNTDDEYSIKIRGKEYRNDGYTQREDGTNVSIRALDAEENGTHSKGNFIKAYKVAKKDFDLLASLGVIKNTEWHHTGTNFNKTDYFSWADSEKADGDVEYGELAEIDPNSMAEIYKTNKKEIGQLTDEYNNAKWGSLVKEREKLPTIEYITERYIQESNPEKYSLSDWLTKEEKNSKSAEHEEISRGGEAYGTSYERRQMHEGVDYKYDKIAYDRKKEWAESHKDDIRRKYDEIVARVEKYNAEILPLEDVFANDAKGKPLMKLLEMFGYSADDAAKKIYHLQYQYYSDTIDKRMAEASEKVRKEYDAKIESARVDFNKWLSKALKDGKAEFIERVPSEPENFITTKEEMNGRYGWFEASSRYNLPRYYSGYKFKTKRMYDSYKKREEDIFKIELEQISKTREASNNVYDEYLKASHAVREDLVEKPLVQGDYSIKGGNTPERRADEVARLKQKIEQLSQEKDAIAEDGAKVKDIASEMTNFIKQNISTEVQNDMTRNQFKGILNQLENAITKKDLEKPMQMIEHIGTNVTRRSLTRQMRTFLKSEFKSMTPQGAVKAKTVDGATSRVLELAKTMYATMNKLPLGGEVAALQKQMRDLKADATEWAKDQSADTKNLLADVLKVTERPAATRYNELAELRNKVAADGSASGEMLGYIDHMLDIMGDIDYFRGEQQKAKEASALNSKEDLEALKSELLDKSDKGILSEEDKAVLDNMPLYEMMVNLRQQQLDIDGGGAASIDAQIRNKQNAIKAYRAKMNELPKTDTTGRERYKKLIEQVEGEIDDLFASRIVDQKAVNNGMRELIDDLVTLKEQGHSRLVEWSKGKQERSNGIRKLANDSFSSTARGYWDEVNKSGHRLRDINNFLNNAKLTVLSPALSFEYMLGTLDKKYYTNDSPIYNRFIKSQDGLLKANDNFFEGLESYNKEVNEAANRLIGRGAITNMAEWFKLGDRFATEEIPFAFEVDQMFDDGTVRKVTKGIKATMTRGQAAKIYAWSRMADGMAKLKAHGVTDETIAAVKDFIGEGYMRFVDWVEDDFFPRLRREKYNPKYKEIYGISMAENEHYFPFAIYKKDVRTNTDLEQIGDDKLGGGLVGNLIERKRNNARLDFTRKSPDIFDMITRYGETMEEWTAYAQVREDLKAMVNDKQFKVKCDMFGTDYYKHFLEAARVASRTSDDKALAGKWNTTMSKLQKVLASGAISMRVSTALKQLLSAPAFAVYSLDPKFVHQLEKTVVPVDVESAIKGLWKISSGDLAEAKKLLLSENWVGHYNWCVNNLPSFRERVSLGGAGNPILEEKGFGGFFGKLCDAVQSAGMIPNRLVDAFTCSVGAKAIYEYNFNKYKKIYGEKTAHNMAVTEAEIAFNSSQQSSNPVFLSPMQVTKQFFVRGLMNFKNSPIGYLRAGLKANTDIVRAIKSIYNPTFKVDGQEMRFNSNGKNAASMLMTAAARSAMYNFFLNFIWNLGTVGIAGLSYTAMRNLSSEGNEDGNLLYTDEEWKKAEGDNLAGTLFLCATQGLPYISGPFATAEQGTEFAPLMLLNTLNEMGTDIYQSGLVSPVAAQWIVNLALKNGAGIDPQVCAQVYEGLQGILTDRPVTEEDIMNLLASPRSAISGMTKQKVGEFDRMRDYVDARIKSNREIGIDERMDFGKALAGKRELRKSNLDYYIDEYLEANIPGYREISGRKSKETKQEEQANKKLYEQSMSLVEKIVGDPKGEADEQKASKIDSKDEDMKYMVRRLRDAVAAIHKLYAAGDYGTAEDIAEEMKRRIERGYDPNGKTLDERLKNVDIWEPVGKVNQDSPDGYYTNFDRAIGGEFKKMYVGKMNGEGN